MLLGISRFDNSLYQRFKMLAFGVYPDISLAEAREKRDTARKLIVNGFDPSEKRKEVKEGCRNRFESIMVLNSFQLTY